MKLGLLTINDNNNYGNRLQNYASYYYFNKNGFYCETIKNLSGDSRINFVYNIKMLIKMFSLIKKHNYAFKRYLNFRRFNKNIIFSKYKIINYRVPNNLCDCYDYFLTGSNQVWNPYFERLSSVDLLSFVPAKKRLSLSASFGISELPEKYEKNAKKELLKFKAISVREDTGKNIIMKLTDRNDIEVLIDPTLLLTSDEWNNVLVKPKIFKSKKYILLYFLGEIDSKIYTKILEFAKKEKCDIINILDVHSPYYSCGPSEFLYLEKNAYLVCTDSFHSCVFSFIFNKPFIIFERKDSNKFNMNTRIQTFVNKFELYDRTYSGESIKKYLKYDYNNSYRILDIEKDKFNNFIKRNLN